jgi:transcriptional regulator with GAF, ATPase, and Fis domain
MLGPVKTTASDGGGPEDAASPGWVLVVDLGAEIRAFALPAAGEVTIGRDPACEVAIDHDKVSRRHARIRLGARWTLDDLGSRNGTRARGADLVAGTPAELVAGEPFSVGPFTAMVVPRAVSAMRTALGASHVDIDDPALDRPSPTVVAVARSPISLILTGETGSGKEVLAAALHRLSGRSGRFVAVNCAALSPHLVESELFGHEKGAFTGAVGKPGLLEAAAGGTILLDEIGELALELQAKLLRAIEAREVIRVGGTAPIAIDARFLAATHKDLVAAVAGGTFRRDLYYRLAGLTLRVPPLRERRHQVVPLATKFARAATGRDGALGPAAVARLTAHDWPGNARELKSVVERAALLAGDGPIGAEHVLIDAAAAPAPAASAPVVATAGADDLAPAERAERDRIVAALEACTWNQTRAAKQLGMSRATLVNKLGRYRIPRPRQR